MVSEAKRQKGVQQAPRRGDCRGRPPSLPPHARLKPMSGLRVRIQVPEDHVVKLPDEVPVGTVELIIVTPAASHDVNARMAVARALLRTSPPQKTDSTALIREDRLR
jgi:hypothetical protein